MRVVAVRRYEYEFAYARGLPRIEEVVEHSVKGLFSQRRVPREASFGVNVDSILHRRRSQHAIFR